MSTVPSRMVGRGRTATKVARLIDRLVNGVERQSAKCDPRKSATVCFGSLAALQHPTSRTAAFGGILLKKSRFMRDFEARKQTPYLNGVVMV